MMPARSDGWLPKPWYVFLQVLPKKKVWVPVGAEGFKKSWNILAKPPKLNFFAIGTLPTWKSYNCLITVL